jgi:hypothetical protein
MKPLFDPNHPIAIAVAPLRAAAIKSAEDWIRERIKTSTALLIARDWDLNKAAPRSDSMKTSRLQYESAMGLRNWLQSLTLSNEERNGPYYSRNRNSPEYRQMAYPNHAEIIEQAKEQAAAQYDAFVCKLIKKIGPVNRALLQEQGVWQYSILSVRKLDGPRVRWEHWKTQQIENVSVLGNYFPQWPTRLMKS